MREQAALVGVKVKIVSPSELDENPESWGDAQAYFPLAVEPSYSAEEMLFISNAVLFYGVQIKPVGTREIWERMVPTEMPELLAVRTCSVDDAAWYTPLVNSSARNEAPACEPDADGCYMLKNTKVDATPPCLRAPLADLSSAFIEPEVVIDVALLDSRGRPAPWVESPPKPPVMRYVLMGVCATVVLIIVGILLAVA